MFKLTDRERQVLSLLYLSDKEISKVLNISINTVKTHVSIIKQKLCSNNRTDSFRLGVTAGLIDYER